MKNDELEMWRRQWQSQPAVPLDLIRKVERQTAYMRLSWIPQMAPALIGVFAVIGAVVSRHLGWIVLAAGIWTFLAVAWLFKLRNTRGVWAPATETTAAYIELSIERCRRKLARFRFSRIMICFKTSLWLSGRLCPVSAAKARNVPSFSESRRIALSNSWWNAAASPRLMKTSN